MVLPAIRYWDKVKDDKTCKVDTTTIKIASVDLGTDAGGNHTDTKVVFYADKDKVVCHLYNTTQRIMVNGHGCEQFIEIFLMPFFQEKISQNIKNVDLYNKEALSALSGKRKAITRPTRSVRYRAMVRPACNQCDESFTNKSLLGAHTKSMHKKFSMNMTVNNSPIPIIIEIYFF